MVLASVGCGRLGQEPAVGAQAPAGSPARPDRADPTTSWSDERIADFWKQVAAGPSLKPASWPNGATVAVALSFDFQMGTVYDPPSPMIKSCGC